MTFDSKVSRRDFLKFLAAGATTIAFGSVLGFSSFFSTNKNGRSGIGIGGGGIPQAAAQPAPGTFVLGPNTVNISIHAANLTNGKIFYAAGSGFHSFYQTGPFHWNTFDPESGSITSHTIDKDIFCMGQAVLANGKVLCAGGTLEYDVGDNPDGVWKGLDAAYEYDPDSNSLQEVQSMQHGRWYPHCIPLEDGKVLTVGGWDEWGGKNRLAEIYDPDSKSWSIKYDPISQPSITYNPTYCVGEGNPLAPPGQPCYGQTGQGALSSLSLYPRMLLMPTGLVAVAGQSKTTKTWNPQTGELKFAGELARERNYGNMVMLPLNNDPAETGQLLACGGSKGAAYVADTVAEILTPKPPNYNSFTFQIIAPCNFARRHAPNAYLPDGKIIFFGGTDYQNSMTSGSNMTPDTPDNPSVPQSWGGAHLNAEIFDPVAKSWTVVNGMNKPKIYHCTGILLTDGRVWLAGSQYAKSDWELQSEFYVPSYYNATRPTISDEPTVGGYGGVINIPTPDAANIEKVSLIALSTFTHGFSSQLRFIWLQIRSKGSGSVTVSAPVNAKIAPPGYYMIHILDSAGVPSKAKIIKIPGTAPPPPDTAAPTVGITSPSDGATITGPSSGVTVPIAGTASDESGGSGIQKVEVKVGSNPLKLATATGPGGSADWSTWSASDVVTSAGSTTILARATDNAGNTKDSTINATIAFTGSGTYTSIYSQAGTNSYLPLNTGSSHRAGEIMTSASVLIGNSVKRVSVKLKKAGNPTGQITVRVRKGTADSDGIIFGTIDAATLTTTDQTFTLESPVSHTFAANDKVLVEWEGTGTSTDQVLVKRHAYTADPAASFDGINTKQTTKVATSTVYGINNNYDVAGDWFRFDASPPDTAAPTVGITSPSDGATITGPSSGVTVPIAGTASDESGGSGIQKVEVKVGSNPLKLATATGPGGSADWSTWSASDVVTSAGSTTIVTRATDNAGNTKDSTITVNVTFTGSGTYTSIYSQAGTNSYLPLNSGGSGSHRAGEIMTSASVLIGNSIKKLTVKLKKAGNPTGTITVRVRKGTVDSDGIIFGTIDAATLTTADQTFTLESQTSHTFAANDKVLVEWEGTGTSTDQVLVKRHAYTADPAASFDGINTKQTTKVATSTVYGINNNYDVAGEWFKFDTTSSPDTAAPTIGITSPSDGATITGPSTGVTVAVAGTASDESGGSGIQKVEVKVGSNPFKLATATGPGGSADWSTWSASDVVTSAGSTTIIGRATDNAGNTKDDTINVTVTFTGSGTYTTIYSQAGTNSYMILNTGGSHRAGEIMTSASVLIGNSIKKLTVILKKAGSPTGQITVRVRKGTADSDGIIFGTIDAATLTTTDQTFTLESPVSHTFAANDKVLVEWEGTGTSTDQVLVKRHAYTDPAASFDGINTKQAHKAATSGGYSSYNNADIAGQWSKLE